MCNELPGSLICSFVNEHLPASVMTNRCECVCLICWDSSCWTVKAVKSLLGEQTPTLWPHTLIHLDISMRGVRASRMCVCVCVHVFSRTVSVSSVPCSCHPGAKSVPRSAKTVTLHICTSPPSHTQDSYTLIIIAGVPENWSRWQILRSFDLFLDICIWKCAQTLNGSVI